MITLVEIAQDDLDYIYNIRNKSEIRKMMFNSKELNYSDHCIYWNILINKVNGLNFVIKSNDVNCGVIKAVEDNDDMAYYIDIFLDPHYQGTGIGQNAVKLYMNSANLNHGYKVIAQVKPENIGSIRMFSKVGFKQKFVQLEFENN